MNLITKASLDIEEIFDLFAAVFNLKHCLSKSNRKMKEDRHQWDIVGIIPDRILVKLSSR